MNDPDLPRTLTAEHRALDELLGRFLAAAQRRDPEAARSAARAFDEELRRHMRFEEEHVLPEASGHKLAPGLQESDAERLFRELRVEHVQIRELSGMMRRLLEEGPGVEGARRLFPNLARRWDAHTAREEAAFPHLPQPPQH